MMDRKFIDKATLLASLDDAGEHEPVIADIADRLLSVVEITEYTVTEMDSKRVPYRWVCEVMDGELEKHSGVGDTRAEAIIRACMNLWEGQPHDNE